MARPTTTTPDRIPDDAKIAMTADWGTGLYGAPKIAEQMNDRRLRAADAPRGRLLLRH